MASCRECEQGFIEDPSPEARILCKYCDNSFHPNCAGMDANVFKFFVRNRNYMWYCNSCINAGEYHIDLRKHMKQLETIISEMTVKMNEQAKIIERLQQQINDNKTVQTPLISQIVKNWNDECPTPVSTELRRNMRKKNDNKSDKIINSERKGDPVLIVKPVNESDMNEIKSVIKQTLNPVKDPVMSLNVNKNGSIIIKGKDHD
jgi:hypothetical protein